MPDLLIELQSEEIPARMQPRARTDLTRLVTEGLVERGLTYASAQALSTPRRLTLAVAGLSAGSATTREERRGPRVGAPEKAVEGFLRSAGVPREALREVEDKKGRVYLAEIVTPGRPAADIVAEVVEAAVRGFPWPKSMRWGGGSLRWVRPLQGILCLLTDEAGAAVVPLDIDGLRSNDRTVGHRFHAPARFAVTGFDDYRAKLQAAHVTLDAEARADAIWHDVANQAFARGLEPVEDAGLLAEVAGLVEWPVVLLGDIAPEFLDLPAEVLQTSMREHQKFFALRRSATGRIEGFATVANIDAPDGGETILRGNRKVLAARLSDAKFFWENDLRVAQAGMGDWLTSLDRVTFERRLGSQGQRIARIAALARDIAPVVGADPDLAERAARVAKADLASEMVYEFPELQGTMGRHYALAAGMAPEIAAACEDHYRPLGPSDAVPEAPVSMAVALADKIDLLTGFWAIDEKPTGSKDPFALRRAALGVIRIVLGANLRVPLDRFFDSQVLRHRIGAEGGAALDGILAAWVRDGWRTAQEAAARLAEDMPPAWLGAVQGHDPAASDDLVGFFHERLKVHLRDAGMRHDVIDAVLALPGRDDLTLVVKRAEALASVLATEDGENLVQGFRRANNILTQAETADGVEYSYGPDPRLAEGEAERRLFAALDAAEAAIGPAMVAEDFAAAMSAMASLREPVDGFFEAVQVNTENGILRRNRLNLLHRIRAVCLLVADLRRLEG